MSKIIIKKYNKLNALIQKLKKKQKAINSLLKKISKVKIDVILSESERNSQSQSNKN